MRYKIKKTDNLFQILSVANIALQCFTGTNYLTYGVFLYILILKYSKKISNDDFLLYALFVPDKYLQLIAMPIYVLTNSYIRKKRLNNLEILFLLFTSIVGAINCFVYSAMPLGTLFQIGVFYCIFKILATYGNNPDYSNVFRILDLMLPVQVISGTLQIISYKAIGDPVRGTLISAHYLGIYMIIYILLFLRIRPTGMKKWEMWIRIVIAATFIYLSDAKHVWIVFVFAFLVSWLMKKLKIKRKILISVLVMTVIVVGGTFFLSSQAGQDFISKNSMSRIYILNEQYNKKFILFDRTFRQMLSLNGLFGFGVGQYGSQISLTLSKGIIYPWDTSLSAYHYAIEPYAKAMNGIMTEWYTNYGIGMSSMILGYPLVSFVGLFAELGVCGFIWLLGIFEKRFKNDNPTFIIAFFLLTLFDTYFEIPCVLILILVATYSNANKKAIPNRCTNLIK